MKLHVTESGTGERSIVLLHGFNCDSGDWWELTPVLLGRGYRVLGVDLRGHGLSPRADSYRLEEFADDVVDTLAGTHPDVIMGHSLGASVTGLVVDRLLPERAVYLDPPWSPLDEATREALFPDLSAIPLMSDEELAATLRHDFPAWSEKAIEVDVASWRRWDPASAVVAAGPLDTAKPSRPVVPSLAVFAGVGSLTSSADQADARARGFEVRIADGLTHSLFRDDFGLFASTLEGWI
jgi:pimeloyl-ACP methyl ester carboxylesterase